MLHALCLSWAELHCESDVRRLPVWLCLRGASYRRWHLTLLRAVSSLLGSGALHVAV